MRRNSNRITWWMLALVGIALLFPLGNYVLPRLKRNIESKMLEHKMVRSTTATAKGKEYVQFDESNHIYLHEDGYRIERQAGDAEWRVYYQIDNFDQIDEPARGSLLEAEKKRLANGRLRFTILSKDQYDRIEVGDKLQVGWRWRGGDKIEVVSVGKPQP